MPFHPSFASPSSENTCTALMKTFPQSSFFREKRAPELPPPSRIRAINHESGGLLADDLYRPPPVVIPSLGVLVKYGADVTVAEAQTQVMVWQRLQGQVLTPEVFGWAEDGRQVFIYMALIPGDTLLKRWKSLGEDDRLAICAELRRMASSWKGLKHEMQSPYIGSVGNQPLRDMFLHRDASFRGPFYGEDAAQKFHQACEIAIHGELDTAFAHSDLVPPNILLSPGPHPRVAAVIDWGQGGWYPAYWEYCKAKRVRADLYIFDTATQEEWWTKYLPLILDPEPDTIYHPWLYFYISKGI